jgi:hypothetical protein
MRRKHAGRFYEINCGKKMKSIQKFAVPANEFPVPGKRIPVFEKNRESSADRSNRCEISLKPAPKLH